MDFDHHVEWDEKIVMVYLREAAAIHRRLPAVRVQGYQTLWPETIKDEWAKFYDLVNCKARLGPPMPPEVSYQASVMEWLRWLERNEQQIVWMRANNLPWKIMIDRFGQSKPTLWRKLRSNLALIALRLRESENQGQAFVRLRNRATFLALTP